MGVVWEGLAGALGGRGLEAVDEDVRDYCAAVLEADGDAPPDADAVFEAVGEILLDAAGGALDETTLRAACQAAWQPTDGAAAQPAKLARGFVIGDEEEARVFDTPSANTAREKAKALITPVAEAAVPDEARALRRRRKEGRAQAAAEQRLRAELEATAPRPEILRNVGGPRNQDLHLENVSVSNGGAELIQDAKISLVYGRRYGLVGRNGTGKSTLLRAVAGRAVPGLPPDVQVLHVEQEVVGDATPVLDAVLRCDVERWDLLEEELALQAAGGKDGDRLSAIYARLEAIDAFAQEAKAASILAGLSFDDDMMRGPTKALSGGWRMRVAIAQALFVEPDLLLLDEPTNHLDLHAVLWLEERLQKWPGTLVIVSHARDFMNADVLHLQHRKLSCYRGTYDDFEKARNEKRRQLAKQAESQEKRRKHMEEYVAKYRYQAARAKTAQSRIKALSRMVDVVGVIDDPDFKFDFPDPGAVDPPILAFNDVSFTYPGGGRAIFKEVNFGLDLESRVAVVGKNGVGKSTLIGLLSGTLEPTRGHVARNTRIRMATFSQHHVDGLDLTLTPLSCLSHRYPGVKAQVLRAHLGAFGVSGTLALQEIRTLSGGQKSRVALALLTWTKPHLLLLDEPTNHLDMDSVTAMIQALAVFKGGVLVVSHDGHLISSVADELWHVEDGTVSVFPGNFAAYKSQVLQARD